jgi:hypothetical protein
MEFSVVPHTQPSNFQRLAVVIVMAVGILQAAHLTSTPSNSS